MLSNSKLESTIWIRSRLLSEFLEVLGKPGNDEDTAGSPLLPPASSAMVTLRWRHSWEQMTTNSNVWTTQAAQRN